MRTMMLAVAMAMTGCGTAPYPTVTTEPATPEWIYNRCVLQQDEITRDIEAGLPPVLDDAGEDSSERVTAAQCNAAIDELNVGRAERGLPLIPPYTGP